MIAIQQFKKYKARIKYHRTDDLQPDALPDGLELIVRAMWMADDDEKFAGDWIFEPVERGYWLPERDLEIINTYRTMTHAHILDERTSNIGKTKVSFCGESIGNEFHYTGVDHAVADRQANGRLLPYRKCTKIIIQLLNERG